MRVGLLGDSDEVELGWWMWDWISIWHFDDDIATYDRNELTFGVYTALHHVEAKGPGRVSG